MITFDKFIEKYLGKKLDWDGVYGGQCTDLYRYYCNEVLGFEQSVPVGGAADIWHTAQTKYYDFILNEPTAVPQKGDIVIWNRNVGGGFGHVAIFIKGDVNRFTSLDQNWPTLNKVTKTKHNYKNIIGWLRPKGNTAPDLQKEYDDCREARDRHWNDLKELEKVVSKQTKRVLELEKEKRTLNKKLKEEIEKAQKLEELRDKWHKLYKQANANAELNKKESQFCKKKLSEGKEKNLKTASVRVLVIEIMSRILKMP